jgi:hypothetical protein
MGRGWQARLVVVGAALGVAACSDGGRSAAEWELVRANGRDLVLAVVIGSSSCNSVGSIDVAEDETQVRIEVQVDTSSGDCTADLASREITVTLDEGLGSRRLQGCRPGDPVAGGGLPERENDDCAPPLDDSGRLEPPYLLRPPDEEWRLVSAFDLLAPSPGEPSLDWVADFERHPANAPDRVRVSGHVGDLDDMVEELSGFALDHVGVGALPGLAGRGPDGPSVVIIGLGDGTVMTLSYELSVDELTEWAGGLDTVTPEEWVAAGGEIERSP